MTPTEQAAHDYAESKSIGFEGQARADKYITCYNAFLAGAGNEKWNYVNRDGLPDHNRVVDISYSCSGWSGGFIDEANLVEGVWQQRGYLLNPNWLVYAWKEKQLESAAPLKPV